jgi:TonB-linked SusC/RagA family outer membrane protein
MRHVLSSLLLLLFSLSTAWAQSKKISGKVLDELGDPLSGVSVLIRGASSGTSTNDKGEFSLNTNASGTIELVFSYTGYNTQSIKTDGSKPVSVVLMKADATLDDVVVIGYGQVRKKDLTGAVGVLTGKDLVKTPVANATEALTGRIAGLQVTTTEGSPDAEIKIRLRGGTSISQDNSPLFIVDGFPVDNISNIAPNDIENITFLKDAASTAIYGSRASNGVILITTKEGKAGKAQVNFNTYVGFRKVTRYQNVLSPYEYVRYQYELDPTANQPTTFENFYGAFDDLDIYKSQQGTDWQKELFGRTALQRFYNLGISGGSKETRYNLGVNRNEEDAVMIGSYYARNNINFKLNSKLSDKFSTDFNVRFSHLKIDGAGVNTGSGANTKLRNAVKYAPTRGLRGFDQNTADLDDQISPESSSLLFDPIFSVLDEFKRQNRFSTVFNGGITFKINKTLSFRSEGSYDIRNERTDFVFGPSTSLSRNNAGLPIGRIANQNGTYWRVSNFFTFDKKNFLPDQNLNIVAGQEVINSQFRLITQEAREFPAGLNADEVLANMVFGTPIPTVTYTSAPDRLTSYFTRANYSLKDKYLVTATFRADGSSKFAPGNKWGFFPAAAIAWKISEENFLKDNLDWLSDLKLRTSIGTTGNNRIPNNAWQLNYNTNDENKPYFPNEAQAPNFIPGGVLQNPNLIWETTINRNVGLDFSLFGTRVNGTIDAYYNTTRDLLVLAPVPSSTGFSSQYQNFGSTSNRGIELTLDAALVRKKDFSLNASFNIGFNKNRVDEFRNGDVDFRYYTSGWNGTADPQEDFLIRQGLPVGLMFGFQTAGMYTFDDFTFNPNTNQWVLNQGVPSNSSLLGVGNYFGPGTLKFVDQPTIDTNGDGIPDAGDGIIDLNDRTIIGNAQPKHFGGFNLNGRYKNFDFTTIFNWTFGNDIYNANKIDYTTYLLTRRYQNLSEEMSLANRFTTVDPETGRNVYWGQFANPDRLREINQNASIWHPLMSRTPLHSWAIEDGSFLRLNTATIGYTLPKAVVQRAKLQSVRVFVSGYNLFVLTRYSGFDPEVDTRRNPPVTPGVDYSAYPKARSFVAGLNVNF